MNTQIKVKVKVNVKKLSETAHLPTYGSAGAAGADLYALTDKDVSIAPGETMTVHTGVALEIPDGYVGLVFARSGLASKRGLAPANKVGVIDSDYRGEIMVALHNHSDMPQTLIPGERVAQIAVMPCCQAIFEVVDSLEDTERGEGGFGSTGRS